MRRQDIDLVLDFLTLVVAIGMSVIIADFTIKIRPPGEMEKAFQRNFAFAVFSFGIFYLLFQSIRYLFSLLFSRFSLTNQTHHFLWVLTIISGTCLFTWFTDKTPFFNAEYFFQSFFASLIFILIPAALFRLPVEILIYWWRARKRMPPSIVK